MSRRKLAGSLILALGLGGTARAQDAAPALNSGDTAWMLTATALVLLMTIPGLALFYGGMVRKKNVLATTAQSFAVTALVSVLWMIIGYSLAFTNGGAFNPYLGGFGYFMLRGLMPQSVYPFVPTIPETVFMCFQMTFAIITPALIAGAFAERMKFSALLLFMSAWLLLVYAPIAHWVWYSADGKAETSGFLFKLGVLDFAGGTVVHLNAGVAGLVCALVLGPRTGYRARGGHQSEALVPHNVVLSLIGASLLWVGWFGFNAGSAGAANALAGMAMANTQVATGGAALSWTFAEWALRGKPSVLGMVSGAVAGLVAVTPASGFVALDGALYIGLIAGLVCFFAAVYLKRRLGYDDSLDAFGVHGLGGLTGAILTGVFAVPAVNSLGTGAIAGNPMQILTQLEGSAIVAAYTAAVTMLILFAIKSTMGLRVDQAAEIEGLDVALHGEHVP
ncbi:MAG: ammonium transporter [Alphaproteobacteria bacterium]